MKLSLFKLGDLVVYWDILLRYATNLKLPYHNLNHISHVIAMCLTACEIHKHELTERQIRNIIIAAIFHDFNHLGIGNHKPDQKNINQAIKALDKYIQKVDVPYFGDIAELITETRFPYEVATEKLPLPMRILRKADLSQVLAPDWITQVIGGLSLEWGVSTVKILQKQEEFITQNLTPSDEWEKIVFGNLPKERIRQAKFLLSLPKNLALH